jgi:hypothetical protein
VIGGVLDTWMLTNNWVRGVDEPRKRGVNLEKLIDHYDHICQVAGNADHIAIGSDLDGAYGKEQSPYDLDTISDLQNLQELLVARGYSERIYKRFFIKTGWALCKSICNLLCYSSPLDREFCLICHPAKCGIESRCMNGKDPAFGRMTTPLLFCFIFYFINLIQ